MSFSLIYLNLFNLLDQNVENAGGDGLNQF